MNKLVLIGNGFDLAHGLKTSYADFILWYLNKRFQNMNMVDNKDLIISIENYSSMKSMAFTSLSDFKRFIKEYRVKIKYLNPFFGELIENAVKKWVDIESQYYLEIVSFIRAMEKNGTPYNFDSEMASLNSCFELVKMNLIVYLKSLELNVEPKTDIFDHLEKIQKSDNDRPENILCLNFNYTSTIKLYVSETEKTKVLNVHGELFKTENPIIFGYGDEMDPYYEKIERLNSNVFLQNIKSFGYLKTQNYRALASFIHSGIYNVSIMGHSCGLSDRILLSTIFQHANCKGIHIYYHQKNESENDFVEKTQEISRHFTAENKGRMRTLITPFSHSEPLVAWKESY